MKKKIFKTTQFSIKNGFNPATPERFAEASQAVESDAPVSIPAGWHGQVMASIRRIGPLRKHSSKNDKTTG